MIIGMTKPDLDSDKALLSYDAVRYCETFFQYCRHIQLYFDEKLTQDELCQLTGIEYRLKTFVFDHANDPSPVKEFVSRYRRLLSQMDRLL